MNFDLRLPLGMIFSLFGAILVAYGAVAPDNEGLALGININLAWGTVILVFGVWMLALALLAAKRRKDRAP